MRCIQCSGRDVHASIRTLLLAERTLSPPFQSSSVPFIISCHTIATKGRKEGLGNAGLMHGQNETLIKNRSQRSVRQPNYHP
eukprot:scaffold3009_cov152-Skeletonema_marinoi.AAC.5